MLLENSFTAFSMSREGFWVRDDSIGMSPKQKIVILSKAKDL